jgi:hypothetical protein
MFKTLFMKVTNFGSLKKSEWSKEFEQLMRSRLIVGTKKYGKINEPRIKKYNRVEAIGIELKNYMKTKNLEHVVGIATLCLLEFEERKKSNRYFNGDSKTVRISHLAK